MAKLGNKVDVFDISENGVEKAKKIAREMGVQVNYFCCDLEKFIFEKEYDVILSHGVLHLPYKDVRDKFITRMQRNIKIGKLFIIMREPLWIRIPVTYTMNMLLRELLQSVLFNKF